MSGWFSRWREERRAKIELRRQEQEKRALLTDISTTVTWKDIDHRVESILRDPRGGAYFVLIGAHKFARIRELMEKAEKFRNKVEVLDILDLPEVFRNCFKCGYSEKFYSEALMAFQVWARKNQKWLKQHLEDDLIFKTRFLLWLKSHDGEKWLTRVSDEVFVGYLGDVLDPIISLLKKKIQEGSHSYGDSFYVRSPSSPPSIDRDWCPGGSGGRESTSKGSIGHDRLNVKTLRLSEWRGRIAAVEQGSLAAAPFRRESALLTGYCFPEI